MPAVRLSRRRRSSLALSLNPAKAGIYGIHSPSRPFTFAPNVTPGTFTEPDSDSSTTPEPSSPTSTLFPPSETPAPPPTRRRLPPGKRRSLGYIPRPPNAFMLFRADFVRQKHVPGSIETNHGSLSKIIGNCWRALPLEEKRVWEVKAKHAKAEHKALYPEYRFRPVHNKNKEKKKEKPATTLEDERRCEEVAQFLLEGKKGDELAAAVRNFDRMRDTTSPAAPPLYPHRRSSSVPLPHNYNPMIALPVLPFLGRSRPASPVHSISRMAYAHRRASSARPAVPRSWTMPAPATLQRDHSPLPDVDTSLFEQSFLSADSSFAFPTHTDAPPFNFSDILTSLPPHATLGPLDTNPYAASGSCISGSLPELDPRAWLPLDPMHAYPHSHTSSAYSGSPASSDRSLPVVHAPQPQLAGGHPAVFNDMWQGFEHTTMYSNGVEQQQMLEMQHGFQPQNQSDGLDMFAEECSTTNFHPGLDSLFNPQMYSTQDLGFGYEYNDMVHD